MNVLIVGGTRFLGRYICEALLRHGHRVSVLNRGRTAGELPDGVQRLTGDKADLTKFIATARAQNPDAIIDTILNDKELEAFVDAFLGRLQRFIHCGSTGVYTPMTWIPAREEDDPQPLPDSVRFNHKLAQDRVLINAYLDRNFPATILRPTMIYGPGDVPLDIWGARNPEFFRMLQRNQRVMIPNDGRALLQPVYVEEIAEAFALALDKPESVGRVYNISGERALPLIEYLQVIKDVLGSSAFVSGMIMEHLLARFEPEGKVNRQGLQFVCEHMSVDIGRAKEELGYAPQMPLQEGMERNIRWMRDAGLLDSP